MVAMSIGDLRHAFYGGGTDVELATMQSFYSAGMTFQDVLNAATATHTGASVPKSVSSALRGTPSLAPSTWPDEGQTNGVSLSMNTRKQHQVLKTGPLRLLWVNTYQHESPLPTNSITVTATIEPGDGNIYPVFFGGKREVVIDPGGFAWSDPIVLPLKVGTPVYTNTHNKVLAGEKVPLMRPLLLPANGEGNDATDGVDKADLTGTPSSIPLTNTKGFYPVVATTSLATMSEKVLGLLADSIGQGSGDTAPGKAGYGFLRRALNGTVPYVSRAAGGESATRWVVGTQSVMGRALLSGCTDVIDQLAVNDTTAGQGLNGLQPLKLAYWADFKVLGVKVWVTTVTPFTDSTDSWATLGNQTVGLGQATRSGYNDWIRDGAPYNAITGAADAVGTVGSVRIGNAAHPVVGYFEVADTVESARNSGKWKAPGYTADGLHPSTKGAIAMAAAISPTIWGGTPLSASLAVGDYPWMARSSSEDSSWFRVCWSPETASFVAVATAGTNRVMTSPDGATWTSRTPPEANAWAGVCWSPTRSLFVAVSQGGTNRVMTSPDGVIWTARAAAAANTWNAVCWSSELALFVAVGQSGTNRVMTSPDGITWTSRAASGAFAWRNVCWSSTLGLFVAIASDAAGQVVMTSPDGINWTGRTPPANNSWFGICWAAGLGLFVAVGTLGTTTRVMTSPDGINWTLRNAAADNDWISVNWSPDLGVLVAVSQTGTGNRVMISFDGINWKLGTTPADNQWRSVCWSPLLGIFTAVAQTGIGNRVMTSL